MKSANDPTDIRNWQRRSDRLTTSGRLEADDLQRLAAIGVRHVINLALDEHPEALEKESAQMADLGMAYTHIPVPFDAPDHSHLDALRAAIKAKDGAVHVHCIMNYRVTAFLYLLDLEEGVAEPEARAKMQEIWDPIASDDPRAAPWRELLHEGFERSA